MKLTQKTKTIVTRVIAALVIVFALNRCTVACNRGRALDKYEATSGHVIDSLNSLSDSLTKQVELLQKDTVYLRQSINDLNSKNAVLVEKSTKQQIVHNHYDSKK